MLSLVTLNKINIYNTSCVFTCESLLLICRPVSCLYEDSLRPKYVHMVDTNIASLYNSPTSSSQKLLACSGQSGKYTQQSISHRPLIAEARIQSQLSPV
jgi:hypothetical protein